MEEQILTALDAWLKEQGYHIGSSSTDWMHRLVMILVILLVAYLAGLACRRVVFPLIGRLVAKTKATWDDYFFEPRVLRSMGSLIPPLVVYILFPVVFNELVEQLWLHFLMQVTKIYLIVVTVRFVFAFVSSLQNYSNLHSGLKNRPLKGVYQMMKILALFLGIIGVVSVLLGQSPMSLFAALGAAATILMLVFKDTIVGLVAGVQLSANDMLRPGDWIKISKIDLDGMVTEVNLTTVKVLNWDNTVTTVPPYTLVSEPFENWRVMQESGGRRVKRALNIDMQSVRFCTSGEVRSWAGEAWFAPLREAEEVINLRVFREYLEDYLRRHPLVNAELMIMVRQLQPTAHGLPLEIYFFSANRNWVPYERLQAEVFDHVLAVLPRFGLRVFQAPSGMDLDRLTIAKG